MLEGEDEIIEIPCILVDMGGTGWPVGGYSASVDRWSSRRGITAPAGGGNFSFNVSKAYLLVYLYGVHAPPSVYYRIYRVKR